MTVLARTYGRALQFVFAVANPFKKRVITTECEVHKFLNLQALNILKKDKHFTQYAFFKQYIQDINEGAVWADQDFKSSNHFYNPYTGKGMYGRSSAKDLAESYYNKSIDLLKKEEIDDAMFYLGAIAHLIQDMAVPQHANVRLLDNHRQYENYVIKTYQNVHDYRDLNGAYKLKSLENYFRFNARVALKVHKHYRHIKKDDERFDKITRCVIPLAERTTAGFMLSFYEKAIEDNPLATNTQRSTL